MSLGDSSTLLDLLKRFFQLFSPFELELQTLLRLRGMVTS